jgi:hypothetical protein
VVQGKGVSLARRMLISGFLALLAPATLAQSPPIPCRENDRSCVFEARKTSEVRTRAYWRDWLARPLSERVGPAPEAMLVYTTLENIIEGFRDRPRATLVPPDLRADFDQAFASLPAKVKELLQPKLAGVFFLENLGSTGFTLQATGGWLKNDVGVIVLDMSILKSYKANQWATRKENTPFRADARHRLEATIEHPAGDSRANAIRYILLHEAAHVIAVGEKFHPDFFASLPREKELQAKYPFTWESWRSDPNAGKWSSVFDSQFGLRRDVVYYATPKLELAGAENIYERLTQTSFPTLYAATNPFEDFAESFVSYVHSVIDKRPWQIRLYRDNELAKTVELCWGQARCERKQKFMEQLLGTR